MRGSEQHNLFDAPATRSPSGPATTRRLAAAGIARRARKLSDVVLSLIAAAGERGLTDHELSQAAGLQLDTARARRCELRDKGAILDSGKRRLTENDRLATVWIAATIASTDADHFDQNNQADPPARSTRATAGSIDPEACDHPDIEEVETFDHFLNRRCRVCGKQLRCRPADRPDASSPNKPR